MNALSNADIDYQVVESARSAMCKAFDTICGGQWIGRLQDGEFPQAATVFAAWHEADRIARKIYDNPNLFDSED